MMPDERHITANREEHGRARPRAWFGSCSALLALAALPGAVLGQDGGPLDDEPARFDPSATGGEIAERAMSLLEAMPWSAHVVMLVGLAAGVALWLYGARLIKPTFGTLGVATGGLVGLLMPPLLGIDTVGGVSGWLIGLGAGMVVGFVIALVLLKIATTLAGGLAFAIAGLLGGLIYIHHAPAPEGEAPAVAIDSPSLPRDPDGNRLHRDPRTGGLVPLRELVMPMDEQTGGANGVDEHLDIMAARIRAVLAEAGETVRDTWRDVEPRDRLILVGSTIGMFSLGLLAGLLMPRKSAALVTSMLGAAIWLSCGAWLIQGVSWLSGARGLTAFSPEGWAIVWGVASVIGLALQIGGLAKTRRRESDDE